MYGPRGESKVKTVIIIQHPCALREDGIALTESVLVAEVRRCPVLAPEKWNTTGKIMPLPSLLPESGSSQRNQAAVFERTYHCHRDGLTDRLACLSLQGVNLLMQRWVFHCSRVVVPSWDFNDVVSPAYEEADIIEDWSTTAIEVGRSFEEATYDANAWLNVDFGGLTRRKALENPQHRSEIRRLARGDAASWRAPVQSPSVDESVGEAS